MLEIRMRPKHQVTLPASVVRAAKLQVDDRMSVVFVNGSIIITPTALVENPPDLMAFAGIGRGLWGETADDVEASIADLKSGWER